MRTEKEIQQEIEYIDQSILKHQDRSNDTKLLFIKEQCYDAIKTLRIRKTILQWVLENKQNDKPIDVVDGMVDWRETQ